MPTNKHRTPVWHCLVSMRNVTVWAALVAMSKRRYLWGRAGNIWVEDRVGLPHRRSVKITEDPLRRPDLYEA